MKTTAARRVLAHLTLILGGGVAAWALTTTVPRTFAYVAGGDRLDVLLDSAASAASLGAIVAVIIATTVTRRQTALATAGLGVALLAGSSITPFLGQLQLRAIAAGLILGGCAALAAAHDRRTLQCALVVGVSAGVVLAGTLERIPQRYRDYALEDSPPSYLLIVLGAFAVLLAASAVARGFGETADRVDGRGRVLLVGLIVPIAGLVLYWLFTRALGSLGSDGAMQSRWMLGLAVVPLLVGAAFALPGMTGAVILAALAFLAAATVGSLGTSTAVAFIAMLLLGTVIGWRRPLPLAGFAVLAVVAAAAIFTDPPFGVVDSVVTVVVLPFAVGLLYASLLPTSAPAVTISVTTPIAVSVPIIAEFGWTAYTPLTSAPPAFSPSSWMWTSTVLSICSVLAAGAAYVVLRRRRGDAPREAAGLSA